MCLVGPAGINFCADQDRVVSATRVVYEGTSASGVRKSESEVTVKAALGELGLSSCNLITSVVVSSFSRTMSMYLHSPKIFGGPTFLRGLDRLGWCLTGASGVLSSRVWFFSEPFLVAASGASTTA